jgi:hypothetical protein
MSPSNASDPPANRFAEAPYYGNGRGGRGSYRDTTAKGYGDDDGHDDTFVYDDVDDDDIGNYSGKDGIMHTSSAIKPKKKPCCSCRCKLCCCFLFVIVIVVVVAATVAQFNHDKAAYVHSQYATLPAAPQELAGWCSTTVESSEDYNNCLLWCHPADCCTVPSDYNEPRVSCLDPTNPTIESICNDYRSGCSLLGQHAGDDAANNSGNGDDGGNNNQQQDNADGAANQDGIDNLDGTADDAGNTDGTGTTTAATDDTNGGNSSNGGNL